MISCKTYEVDCKTYEPGCTKIIGSVKKLMRPIAKLMSPVAQKNYGIGLKNMRSVEEQRRTVNVNDNCEIRCAKKNYECTQCTQNQAREKVGHYHHVTRASKWAWPVMLQLGHRYYITYGLAGIGHCIV